MTERAIVRAVCVQLVDDLAVNLSLKCQWQGECFAINKNAVVGVEHQRCEAAPNRVEDGVRVWVDKNPLKTAQIAMC